MGNEGNELETLKVRMLGCFSMSYGTKAISLKRMEQSKAAKLLQMLLLAGENGISKRELLDYLYESGVETAGNDCNRNLNNVIYRLKKQLRAAGLPDEDCIQIQDGICTFKVSCPLELDTEYFRNLVLEARRKKGQERQECYLKANESYHGALLPGNESDMWFHEKSLELKMLYEETIHELDAAYSQDGKYRELLPVYERAVAIYPFDDWQVWQVRYYLELYCYEEAAKIYNETLERYKRELGRQPVEELRKQFDDLYMDEKNHMAGKKKSADGNYTSIDYLFQTQEGDVAKSLFDKGKQDGAYYCSYPSFVDYCRLLVRGRSCVENKVILMFLTLTYNEKMEIITQNKFSDQMMNLRKAIQTSLRSNDAFTRYGNRHFILALTHLEKTDCSKIFTRIEAAFHRFPQNGCEVWYHASMTQELKNLAENIEVR